MTYHNYGAEFSEERYEILAKALRERDMKIVELQKECDRKQAMLDELSIFENFVSVTKQFFGVMLKQNPNQKIG